MILVPIAQSVPVPTDSWCCAMYCNRYIYDEFVMIRTLDDTENLQARKRSPDGRRISPSLPVSYTPHTAHHYLGTLLISAELVYFLLGVWRAPQLGGT